MTIPKLSRTWIIIGLILLMCAALSGSAILSVQGTQAQENDLQNQDTAAEAERIGVQGVAVNGTAGGETPANMPITLHSIDRVAGRVATVEATTDQNGGFRFDQVTLLAGGSYVLVMDYAGMRYNALLEPAELAEPVELTVYETTQDISVVQVERQAMIIADVNEKEREIAAMELLSINNVSDRTLLPELTNITNPSEISFLRFSLPAEARELDVQSNLPGGDIISIGTGFAVTSPVLPGRRRINYTYKFPYQEEKVTFNQRLIQGAEVYQALIPERLAEIQITPLEAKPRIDVDGTTYLLWESRDIPPGRGITLEFSRLPQPSLPARLGRAVTDGNLWQTAIPLMLGVALTAALLYAWFRGARVAPVATGLVATPPDETQLRRQTLVQYVAALDLQFEEGRIAETEYQAQREKLLAQIRQGGQPSEDERGRDW